MDTAVGLVVCLATLILLGTFVLMASMLVTSRVLGGIDFGSLPSAAMKCMAMLLLVASVHLGSVFCVRCLGYKAALVICLVGLVLWYLGLKAFFQLTSFQALVLVIVNACLSAWLLRLLAL